MNATAILQYVRTGLIKAGLPEKRVTVGMELARPIAHDAAPSASVYLQASRVRRKKQVTRITAAQLQPPVEGAVGGNRTSLMSGTTYAFVTIQERTLEGLENVLSKFLEYLGDTRLVDRVGQEYVVLTEDQELTVEWNDHDAQDLATVSFQIPFPSVVWRDHPLYPIDIELQFRIDLAGADNPDE